MSNIKSNSSSFKPEPQHVIFQDGVSQGGPEYLDSNVGNLVGSASVATAIPLNRRSINLEAVGNSDNSFTLAGGYDGQVIELTLVAKGGTGNAVITSAFNGSNTTATFNAVADSLTLKYVGNQSKWFPVSNISVVIA